MVYKSLAVSSPPPLPLLLLFLRAILLYSRNKYISYFLGELPRGIINYPARCWVCGIDAPSAVGPTTLPPVTLSCSADRED